MIRQQLIKLLWYLLCLMVIKAQANVLHSIDIRSERQQLALTFKLDTQVSYHVFTLANPSRLIVDLKQTRLAFDLAGMPLNHTLIKKIRSGHPKPEILRLVFDVANPMVFHVGKGQIIARQYSFSVAIAPPLNILSKPSSKRPIAPPIHIPKLPIKPLRDVIVVIDPGHGGHDPGAIGPKRHAEKNITLAIAKKLKQHIDNTPGMHAILTRDGDYYVGLRQRLKIARRVNADMFISIHADAFIQAQLSGVSVFALSQRGATSEAARWLAEKENYSELGGVNLAGLDDQSGLVRTVLIDLSQTATIGASLHLGETVLSYLHKFTKLHHSRVEQARFMVLKSPDIPSILIETGFITNPIEENNLTNLSYQHSLTQAIFRALKYYFGQYPPHGTQLEASAGYKVVINSKQAIMVPGIVLPKLVAKIPAITSI